MPETKLMSIKDLELDLFNFRTVPQPDEVQAIHAMIAISSDRFAALVESLLDDGYLPTENIIVLRSANDPSKLVVKEGNRRIAALKLIHGFIPVTGFLIPQNIASRIESLSLDWKQGNEQVPCTIYDSTESTRVDKIVTLAHGKGDKASRDQWTAVARARHNRDVNKISEPGLDLLEKFLEEAKNITTSQAEQWAGDFYLSVLDETMTRYSSRFGASTALELAEKYPNVQYRENLDKILRNIGLGNIGFKLVRNEKEFVTKYDLPPLPPTASGSSSTNAGAGSGAAGGGATGGAGGGAAGGGATGAAGGGAKKKPAASATHDPKTVIQKLKKLKLRGHNRDKVESLRQEAINLNIEKTPLAFCFILRSMFELSAKAYCEDQKGKPNAPSATNPNGSDKELVKVLGQIATYMVNPLGQSKDLAKDKSLHGAITELQNSASILSVKSLNQLIHNPSFSIRAENISTMFSNIFPLLEAMNE